MFNQDKCATSHLGFRESCGMDAFKGHSVTPIKARRRWSSQLDPASLASYVAFSNAAAEAGFLRLAWTIENKVREQFPDLPYSNSLKGYLSFVRPHAYPGPILDVPIRRRFNRRWMRYEVKALALKPVMVSVPCDSWEHVLRRFSIGGTETRAGQYSLPRRAKLIRGWWEE
jgi:hypothetical protein